MTRFLGKHIPHGVLQNGPEKDHVGILIMRPPVAIGYGRK